MKKFFFLCLASAMAAFSQNAGAQNATTTPVGAINLSPRPNSDTVMSVPLNRPSVFSGAIASISGSVVTISGSPGWSTNEFVYTAGTQSNTYYLSFADGAKQGMFYTISANTANSVTLDLSGDDIAAIAPGTKVSITPYWTFGTLFPGGAGVSTTSVHGTHQTEILLPDPTAVGINKAPTATYYYYTGTNPGWRKVGGGLSTVKNDDILYPDSYFIYRQRNSTQNTVQVTGDVQMSAFATPIGNISANVAQDNYIAFPVASSLTLAQTKLYESGAFAGSSLHGTRVDQLFVFDNSPSATGINKSPTQTYYYYTGTNPGWRLVGGGLTTVRDNDVVFQPGQGIIIRRGARLTAGSSIASFVPPYSQ